MKQTKSKATAIVLAFLFGIFSWVYTWKYDYWKFWVGLALCFTVVGGFIAWPWVIIDQISKPKEFFDTYYKD